MFVIAGTPDEIVLPETKPETEWINGRAVPKVSPTWHHGLLQAQLVVLLKPWAKGRGQVATEWRVRVAPPGEVRRPLVPDVSYISFERVRGIPEEALQLPDFPPDVAFEVRSPGDRERDIAEKIRVYLACGSAAVVLVDPKPRSIRIVDSSGECIFAGDDVFEHPALPDFRMPLAELFSVLDERF